MSTIFYDDGLKVIHVNEGNEQSNKIPIPDIRANKPEAAYDQKEDNTVFFQRLIKIQVDDSEFPIAAPNEISMAFNIAKKAIEKSNELRIKVKQTGKKAKSSICDEDVTIAYDYIEEIQKAIVFSYKAVESFCNAVIPDEYIYIKTTNRGIDEHYKKEQIERWLSTSEKVSKLLPNIMGVTSPSQKDFWSNFKNLERLRNEIIHSKSSSSIKVLKELFTPIISDYVASSFDLLSFFIESDPSNPVFPFGFSLSSIQIKSFENLGEMFKEA